MDENKEAFEMPEVEVIELDKSDVIVTSGCSNPLIAGSDETQVI